MDYETKILLNRLVEEVEKLNSPDWWIIGITVVSIIISGILSYLLFRLTKKLGEQQNTLQQNNLRIQMHQKYFEIYDALCNDWQMIKSLNHKFDSVMNGVLEFGVCDSKVQNVLDNAKQILPSKQLGNLVLFFTDYSAIKKTTSQLYSYIDQLDIETRRILEDKLKTEGLVGFLEKLYEVKGYDDINVYCNSIRRLFNLVESGFIEQIRSYSDLSDIVKCK